MRKGLLSNKLGAATVGALILSTGGLLKGQTSGDYNGLQWSLYQNGSSPAVIIPGYNGPGGNVVISTLYQRVSSCSTFPSLPKLHDYNRRYNPWQRHRSGRICIRWLHELKKRDNGKWGSIH